MSEKPIVLYGFPTPNGHAITILYEELKAVYPSFDYELKTVNIRENEQKSDWFLKVNPNGRIPAITDRARDNFNVFETSAILLYTAQHYDKDFKFSFDPVSDPNNYSEMVQWLFFAHGGIGPMQGQAHHFLHYAPEDIPYAKNRYVEETKRLYGVLEIRLKDRDFLAGSGRGKYSLADIKTFPWIRYATNAKIEGFEKLFPSVKAWLDRCEARSASKAGLGIQG